MGNTRTTFLDKVKKKLKSGAWYPFYNTFYEKVSLDPKEILLYSRSGIAVESNILALLKELQKPDYSHFRLVLAIRKDKLPEIRKKLERYNIRVSKIIYTGKPEFYYHLSRAKYLINDVTFPLRFIKKEGQVYLNVWHGTPLKRMGQENTEERYACGNVMRNLLMSDYLVFPNLYMEEKMDSSHNLSTLYQGRILHEGYPRNSIFFNKEAGLRLKKSLGYSDKQLSVYMPTFRGHTDNVENDRYLEEVNRYLKVIDDGLSEDQILLIKLHPLVQRFVKNEDYRHIRPFPLEYDTYDVLNACDVLITDYSSVMYDFATAGRKIILFAYDLQDYCSHRGVYEDIRDYPFSFAQTAEEVLRALKDPDSGYPDQAFIRRYCTFEHPNASERILRHVILGEKICGEQKMPGTKKRKVLLYPASLLPNGITTSFLSMIRHLDREKCQYYICFRTPSIQDHPECLDELPSDYPIYPLASEMNLDVLTAIAQLCYLKWGWRGFGIEKRLTKAYKREWQKHFGAVSFDHVVQYDGYDSYMDSLFEIAPCTRTVWVHSNMEQELLTKKSLSRFVFKRTYSSYDHVVAVGEDSRKAVEHLSGRSDNLMVIPNYTDWQRIRSMAEMPLTFDEQTKANINISRLKEILESSDQKFITIGRFSAEKAHDRLLRAFDRFWKDHKNTWLIVIGGEGALYDSICTLAKSLPSGDHIILIRYMSNPMAVLKSCNLFLLSSHYEGVPVVIMEADILNVPAAACDVSGTHTFMKEYGGTLVEDSEEGVYHAMELFEEGAVNCMAIDAEKRNREMLRKCEELFLE